jgi:hypothetical protein
VRRDREDSDIRIPACRDHHDRLVIALVNERQTDNLTFKFEEQLIHQAL